MQRKIKVAHIIARMITGGADENTLFTVQGLDKDRYEVDLIMGEEFDESIFDRVKNNNFDIIQIKGLKWKLNFLYDPVVLLKLIKLLKKKRYDIVHTHTTKAGILGRIAARIAGVPIIVHGLHGSTFQAFNSGLLNWLLFLFERLTGRFTDAYISVSKVLSETYIKKGIGKKGNHYTVYSGMELYKFYHARDKINYKEKYEELGINVGEFLIGNVARLETRKGHKFLLDAFKNVVKEQKDGHVKLLIIGEGNKRKYLENYVEELNLGDKVIFTGYREDVEELMALMDIFVLTSLREGLPRVLVQAAAVGMPSVAFNVDGVPEIIKDNYNGFFVRPRDVGQLTNRIEKYINNKELVLLHGQKGREFIKDRWSIEGMVDRIDKIYQNLVREKINNNKYITQDEKKNWGK
ncbi:MAG: glycosyltransferase family 4 protein [Candidatus Atribacteria bacterium]|nr:glycosyltransferase family 4 protein [Candidatus Atribacteria bacterium]